MAHRFLQALDLRPGCRQGQGEDEQVTQGGVKQEVVGAYRRAGLHRQALTWPLHLEQEQVQAGAEPGGLAVLEGLSITRLCRVPWGPSGCGWRG